MARSSQSRSQTPSQPPSCRSTRQIITPARFSQIPTPSDIDSQNSSAFFRARSPQLSQSDNRKRSRKRPSSISTPVKEKPKNQKRNKRTLLTSNNESPSTLIDLVQDSSEENSKITDNKSKKSSPFDKVTDYFEEPHYRNEGDTGEKLMYECKWCRHVYKKSE
ncbi:hypothetical protein H4Q26_004084, partial [Puccinia striiformis f. sp. tritici PST-130]